MKAGLIHVTACSLSLMVFAAAEYPPAASAQPAPQDSQAATYPPQQLDQLLAPVALYPDPLLAQILMASTYPLEVVDAARWVNDPNNASLRGDQLDAALQQQAWDPSVKSLVPFPQILQMMNNKLDWTQSLGNAFLAQQASVMDSVQRLRGEAQTAGTLRSTPQQTVSTQGPAIMIEPANSQMAYVPYYDPRFVYGSWGYPDYPPVYFPPPPNYGYVVGPGIYFGIGFGIVGSLWGWDRWDWGHHDIHIDADRYNGINNYAITHDNRPRYTENSWRHDPAQRRGVPYGDPALRQRFQPASTGSADTRRDFRGFEGHAGMPGAANQAAPHQARPGPLAAAPTPPVAHTMTAPPPQHAPAAMGAAPPAHTMTAPPPQHAPAAMGAAPPNPSVRRPAAPAFASFGRAPDVRAQAQRGQASRQSMPAAPPPPQRAAAPQQRSAPPPPHSAPPGGGQKGGGNENSGTKTPGRQDDQPGQHAMREKLMVKWNENVSRTVLRGAVMGMVAAIAWSAMPMTAIAGQPRQMTFASPEDATAELVAAERAGRTVELVKILGPAGRQLILSGDPVADREGREKFVAAYDEKHVIDRQSDSKAILAVSADDWPFPIPLVKQGGTWRFDTKDGAEEILNRRIGRNELNAIQVCAAIVDAEHDYAREDRTGAGYREYAQKFMSSDGKRDGLYWPSTGVEDSPIGPLVASARAEGYGPKGPHQKPTPFHGYFYRILKQQGKAAAGGAYGYVVNGHMIGGFALVAFPAKYGDSGVMTFIVNQDGVIYERNLGPDTATIARAIKAFDPDGRWQKHQ